MAANKFRNMRYHIILYFNIFKYFYFKNVNMYKNLVGLD